jgi:hypothetical protein
MIVIIFLTYVLNICLYEFFIYIDIYYIRYFKISHTNIVCIMIIILIPLHKNSTTFFMNI